MLLAHRGLLGRCSHRFYQSVTNWRHFRQPEIQNLGVSTLGHKNVGGLDVAVNDAFDVGGVQSVGNLDGQAEQNFRLDGLSGDAMLQSHTVQELHNEERMAVMLPDLMNRADIGMIESRGRLRLPLETSQCWGISGDLVRQELQGNKAMQGDVLRLVHHAHAATAQLLDDAVVRDGLADHGGAQPEGAVMLCVLGAASQSSREAYTTRFVAVHARYSDCAWHS